jgi:hypothetical protein
MPKTPTRTNPLVKAADKVAAALAGFDYGVELDDFVLYELSRLIDEERASFDDTDFRNLIDEGIRGHIEENVSVRARLAGALRSAGFAGQTKTVALRVVHALEDLQADLCNVAVLVRNYTTYLLSRLEALESVAHSEKDDRITAAADLLFESTGDRDAAETALAVLCANRSAVTARVLAHAVSEPLLDEDLEQRAFEALKALWPLPRRFMRYNLIGHPHEDIPLRWFQLFVEMDELSCVDLALEELRAHGESPRYREDLSVLLAQLHGCRDPELEDKILGAVNAPGVSSEAAGLLREFLEEHRPVTSGAAPWKAREETLELNRRYLGAARLFDQGDVDRAREALAGILAVEPKHELAAMLTALLPYGR